MKPYYDDGWVKQYCGDALVVLPQLEAESVQCVVTSPPYWGLRKYSGEQEMVWGDNLCKHEWVEELVPGSKSGPHGPASVIGAKFAQDQVRRRQPTNHCSLCGAWRGAYGLEPDPSMYVSHTIEFLRAIRRVLRKDGIVFWNIKDTYITGKGSCFNPGGGSKSWQSWIDRAVNYPRGRDAPNRMFTTIPGNNLALIPSRMATAAQEDGWVVRAEIIWEKPNPMPQSIDGWRWEKHRIRMKTGRAEVGETKADRPLESPAHPYRGDGWEVQSIEGRPDSEYIDCPGCPKCLPNDGYVLRKGSWRPTESHEYILMLTKPGKYYADREAVKEKAPSRPSGNRQRKYRQDYGGIPDDSRHQAFSIPYQPDGTGRNIRSVWSMTTVPFPSQLVDGQKIDHFAVFPAELPRRCILAATSEAGNCSKCGKPWVRIRESTGKVKQGWGVQSKIPPESGGHSGLKTKMINQFETLGWNPQCSCNAPTEPAIVLDPFAGKGTVGEVAKSLGRKAILIDISEEYCKLAKKGIEAIPLPLRAR